MHAVDTVGQLNAFLLGELAAVEMYRQALGAPCPSAMKAELTECKHSHEMRSTILRETIDSLGGKRSVTTNLRRTWEKLVAARSGASPDQTGIDALERAEERMLTRYRTDTEKLEPAVRIFVEATLVEQQEHTHRAVAGLKRGLIRS